MADFIDDDGVGRDVVPAHLGDEQGALRGLLDSSCECGPKGFGQLGRRQAGGDGRHDIRVSRPRVEKGPAFLAVDLDVFSNPPHGCSGNRKPGYSLGHW